MVVIGVVVVVVHVPVSQKKASPKIQKDKCLSLKLTVMVNLRDLGVLDLLS